MKSNIDGELLKICEAAIKYSDNPDNWPGFHDLLLYDDKLPPKTVYSLLVELKAARETIEDQNMNVKRLERACNEWDRSYRKLENKVARLQLKLRDACND